MHWILFALLAALFAALVAIFAKLGLKGVDTTLSTTLRAIIMAFFMVIVSLSLQKFKGFSIDDISTKDWLLIIASGVAGALSWLFYFVALKDGPVQGVVALDKLSVVFAIVIAGAILSESLSLKTIGGALLMGAGAILIAL